MSTHNRYCLDTDGVLCTCDREDYIERLESQLKLAELNVKELKKTSIAHREENDALRLRVTELERLLASRIDQVAYLEKRLESK